MIITIGSVIVDMVFVIAVVVGFSVDSMRL